eukprot:3724807-Amphidinium_carterae.1
MDPLMLSLFAIVATHPVKQTYVLHFLRLDISLIELDKFFSTNPLAQCQLILKGTLHGDCGRCGTPVRADDSIDFMAVRRSAGQAENH